VARAAAAAARAGAAARLAGAALLGGRTAAPLGPPRAGAGDALLVADLAGAVREGRGAVAAPGGAALGPAAFADVRPLAVTAPDRPRGDAGPDARRWLYLHPPAAAEVEVAVPADGAYLQAGLALDPRAWDAPLGDGVRFLATVRPLDGPAAGAGGGGAAAGAGAGAAAGAAGAGAGGGAAATVVDVVLNPRARGEQRRWVDVVADLGPWAGRRVALRLATEGRADPAYDWAGWGNPAVVRADALTAARLRESARQTAALALRD
jgi:hypothetical protein